MTSYSSPKLILIYAGYGDSLLLQIQPKRNSNEKPYATPRYWLIDGGPIFLHPPEMQSGTKRQKISDEGEDTIQQYNSYYQYLRGALLRHCRSNSSDFVIDLLEGIIVTHPHRDHMDGVIQLMFDWLPDKDNSPTKERPLKFRGPVILNGRFFSADKNGPDSKLVEILKARGFVKAELRPRDPSVPRELTNESELNEAIFKMEYSNSKPMGTSLLSASPSSQRKTEIPINNQTIPSLRLMKGLVTVDDSGENKSSIVSIWQGESEKPIVTTGDNNGANILDIMHDVFEIDEESGKFKVDLGIFKVPHHGSQRNSLVDNKFLITESQNDNHCAEFLFLYLVSSSISEALPGDLPPGSNNIQSMLTNFKDRCQDKIISIWPDNDNNGTHGVFTFRLRIVAKSFAEYLSRVRFKYTDTTQNPPDIPLYDEAKHRSDVLYYKTVVPFAERLLERHGQMEDAVRQGKPEEFNDLRSTSPFNTFKRTGEGDIKTGFKISDFSVQNNLIGPEPYLPHRQDGAQKVDDVYLNVVKALTYNPNTTSLLLQGLLAFYKRVRAQNYAISAQGRQGSYFHPNPTTVAAIMAAAILEKRKPPVRIFVTDAGSLKIKQIADHVTFLTCSQRDKWHENAQLFYLENDYQAEIPFDDSVVEGSTVFRFDLQDDLDERRKELGDQFKRADAYNLPFSHDQPDDTDYLISVLDTAKNKIGWLQLDIPTTQLIFLSINTTPTPFQLEDKGRLNSKVEGALNQTKFRLIFEAKNVKQIEDEFIFLVIEISENSGAKFKMKNIKTEEILCFDENTKAFSWEPAATATSFARLKFERKDPKWPQVPLSSVTATSRSAILLEESSLQAYLKAIGYKESVRQISLVGLAGTIADAGYMWGFFSQLPSSICTLIELPTWKVDDKQTDITFGFSPLGIDVSKAEILAVVPSTLKEINVAGFRFSVTAAKLLLIGTVLGGSSSFSTTLFMGLRVSTETSKLDFQLKASLKQNGLASLDVLASSSMSPSEIFNALELPLTDGFKLLFGGPTLPIGVKLDYIGFRVEQPCMESHQLKLQSIYFRITADMWKDASWVKTIPDNLQPQLLSEVSVAVTLLQPQSVKSLSVGLRIDFPIHISTKNADLLLSMSVYPAKSDVKDSERRFGFSVVSDPRSDLPIPTIDDVMKRLGGQTWNAVVDTFPFLESITTAIAFRRASLVVGSNSQGSPEVSAFSVAAQITDFRFLNTPNLVVKEGLLSVDYNRGTGWSGRVDTVILFAGKYSVGVRIVLPTTTDAGSFEFSNLNDDFTLGALVKEIDSSIDLNTVPIIGSNTLATIRLDYASLVVQYLGGKVSLTGFDVQIKWESHAIGQINAFANHLSVSWNKNGFSNIPSIEGAPTSGSQSVWRVEWEGQISNTWGLTATAQYSSITAEDSKPDTKLVFGGSILNMSGQMQLGDLTNKLTQPTSESENTLWQDMIPSKVNGSFLLRRCATNCIIGTPAVFAVGASATWGQDSAGEAVLVVRRGNDTKKPWEFMAAISVNNFRFSDVYSDSELAGMIDKHLSLVRVSLLAFYSPGSTSLKKIQSYLSNAVSSKLLPPGSDFLPLADVVPDASLKFTSGLAIFASLNFQSPPPDSVTSNFDVASNGSLSTSSSTVQVSGYFGTTTDSSRIVTFEGFIDSLQILSFVKLTKLQLQFTSEIKDSPKSVINTFRLDGECHLQFGQDQAWVLTGNLQVDSSQASLKFQLLTKEVTLLETIELKMSNIAFSVEYIYATKDIAADEAPNSGVVKSGARSATYRLSLSASVALGSVKGIVTFLYTSETPGVLVVDVPVDLNTSVLFQELFGDSFPSDLLNISFQTPLVYYAWKSGIKTTSIARGPHGGIYLQGFHGEANVNVYGIAFILSLHIVNGTPDEKGIEMDATLAKPVEVIAIKLHGKDDATVGPTFGFSTIKKNKGLFFTSGFALFGTEIPGSLILTYNSSTSALRGGITIKSSFLQGGSADIIVELSKKNGKYDLRFVNLPSVFQDIFDMAKLIKVISDLSSQDGSPCGAITLAFDQLVKSKVNADVKLDNSQGGLDPGTGPSGVTAIKLSVAGKYNLEIGGNTIAGIEFKELTFSEVKIPKRLDDLWSSLVDLLGKSAESIIKGLWDDKAKLAEVIALVALKKLTPRAIKALICRDYYKPPKDVKDPPGNDQKSEAKDSIDGGGEDGDGAGDEGKGNGLPDNGKSDRTDGGTKSFKKWLESIISSLLSFLMGLFNLIPPLIPPSPPPIPPPPRDPGKPRDPPPDDGYAEMIHKEIEKDFERWNKETDFDAAVKSALDCALDYRSAIGLLRKVLRSPTAVENLGARMFEDYKTRRNWLMYNFSLLSQRFADKWLDISNNKVMVSFIPTTSGRKLQIRWQKLPQNHRALTSALTLYIQGKPVKTLEEYSTSTNTMTMDGPQFDLVNGTQVTAKIVLFAADSGKRSDDEPGYAFSSQGQPATGTYTEVPPTITTKDATTQPTPPGGLEYHNHTGPNSTTPDLRRYPVFQVGQNTYWALSRKDSVAFVILGYDKAGNYIGRWNRAGARYIYKVAYANEVVNFYGQSDRFVSISVHDLLNPATIITSDARAMPTTPSGLVYKHITSESASDNDLENYPILRMGNSTYWALSYTDNRNAMAIIAYDRNNNLVGRWDRSGARYLYRILIGDDTVTFYGQNNQAIALTFEELGNK